VLVVGPTPNRHASLSCPECSGPMRREEVTDTMFGVDICDAHGTWFDARELPAFIETATAARAGEVTSEDLESAGVGGGFFARLFRPSKR
jgi:Zn-finger nucleic acid-binding protein